MIAIIKQIFHRIFLQMEKNSFSELFEQQNIPCRAILLHETCPLSGMRISYLWQEFADDAHLTIREENLKNKTLRTTDNRMLAKNKFEFIINQIEGARSAGIDNYSGKVKDGVIYDLYWGSSSKQTSLRIKNPQAGSKRHQEFIEMLKKNAA